MSRDEKTFRGYTPAQGETYAARRPGYPPKLFEVIVHHHTSTGGQLTTVVDVGCGTGQATQGIAPYFANAIGLDPSEGMIVSARTSAQSVAPVIRFDVSTAETLGADLQPPIADSSVDLVVSANAAHWFDMARFWRSAARVLKPGGSVALWTRTGMSVDRTKTPNGAAIQQEIEAFYEELRPFEETRNILARDLYVDLPLPWTLDDAIDTFGKDSLWRKEWNSSKEGQGDDGGVHTERALTPQAVENVLSTSSSVTRWRDANPSKSGTEQDIIKSMRRRIEGHLREAGVRPDEEVLTGGSNLALLMVKKA